MAQMNRNVNLEEIESDALLGIDALKNQTLLQKIVFFGCVGIGVVLNVSLHSYMEHQPSYAWHYLWYSFYSVLHLDVTIQKT